MTLLNIFAATFGGAVLRELYKKWAAYKRQRRALPADVRNTLLWNDRTIFWGEFLVWAGVVALLGIGFITLAALGDTPWAINLLASWYGIQLPPL